MLVKHVKPSFNGAPPGGEEKEEGDHPCRPQRQRGHRFARFAGGGGGHRAGSCWATGILFSH